MKTNDLTSVVKQRRLCKNLTRQRGRDETRRQSIRKIVDKSIIFREMPEIQALPCLFANQA